MSLGQGAIHAIDRFQRRHGWAGFPFAVVRKYGDDQAGYLAALIAYYGFFSVFPLMLVFVSVLGIVLANSPQLQQQIIDSALAQFPIVGPTIVDAGAMRSRETPSPSRSDSSPPSGPAWASSRRPRTR